MLKQPSPGRMLLRLCPQIMNWLVEAREIAMDQGTSEEKHAVFNKYKGKINNFLSKAGYDSKKGRDNLTKAQKETPANH